MLEAPTLLLRPIDSSGMGNASIPAPRPSPPAVRSLVPTRRAYTCCLLRRLAMRAASVMLLTFVVTAVPSCCVAAQSETKPQQQVVERKDGGTSGRMESIFIPPIAGAPFSLTLATEWSRPLGNGGTVTLVNQRHIVRDGKGRIYQERWLLVPKDGKMESSMDIFQITDPSQHTWLNCETREKVCELLPYNLTTSAVYKPAIAATGPLKDGMGFHLHEDLGMSSSNGLDTTGYRQTTTINPGVMGNDQPMVATREFWYSPQLGINLISKVESPQSGKQT